MKKFTLHFCILASLFFLFVQYNVFAMQSGSYQITTDSLNSGGAENISSASYGLSDTIGEVGTGLSQSANYQLSAGYRSMEVTYISITASADVAIGSIGGLTGGGTGGQSDWNVTTNNGAGYQLTVQSLSTPALTSGPYSFADYMSAGPDPDFTFTNGVSSSSFGFSPEGTDILQKYKDNGSACNAGSLNTANTCWDGFSSTTKVVAEKHSGNHPVGSITTIKYKVESGIQHVQPSGEYTANILITATAL